MAKMKEDVNKSEMIREALREAGPDPSPSGVARTLGDRGIDVSPGFVSIIKSRMKLRRRRARQAANRPKPAPTATATASGGQVAVDDVLTVQDLARRIGPDNLKRLADALA